MIDEPELNDAQELSPQGHVIVAETLVPATVHRGVDFFSIGR